MGNIEAEVGHIDLVVEHTGLVAVGNDHIDPVVDCHIDLEAVVDRIDPAADHTEFVVDCHIDLEAVVDRIDPAADHTGCSRTNNDVAVLWFQVDFHKQGHIVEADHRKG